MRRPSHGNYPSAHVFPGGVLENSDPHLTYCALRETYEEIGLFIPPQPNSPQMDTVGERSYEDALIQSIGSNSQAFDWTGPQSLGLIPFSQWITPPHNKKRFSTQFYIYKAPKTFDVSKVLKSREVDLAEWLSPEDALNKFRHRNISLVPPQFYMLTAISEQGVDKAAQSIGNRIFAPKLMKKFEDGRVQLDWGKGESGILSTDKETGSITDIEYIRSAKI